jgi:hypothetical protein
MMKSKTIDAYFAQIMGIVLGASTALTAGLDVFQ